MMRMLRQFLEVLGCVIGYVILTMISLKVISRRDYENIKKQKKVLLLYGFQETPFGKCLIAVINQMICHFSFVVKSEAVNLNVLQRQWPGGFLIHKKNETGKIVGAIFNSKVEMHEVILMGTDFEAKVWHALLNIPRGQTMSYKEVALMVGHDKAVRAVANAVAKNGVAYLIPCHRVIRNDGNIHKYRWGSEIKKKILQFER